MDEENWQVVSTTSGVIKAKIIEGRLVAEGIPVRLQYEPIGEIYAITVDGLGEVQILVPEVWLEHARRVLEKEYREDEMDWNAEEPQATSRKERRRTIRLIEGSIGSVSSLLLLALCSLLSLCHTATLPTSTLTHFFQCRCAV